MRTAGWFHVKLGFDIFLTPKTTKKEVEEIITAWMRTIDCLDATDFARVLKKAADTTGVYSGGFMLGQRELTVNTLVADSHQKYDTQPIAGNHLLTLQESADLCERNAALCKEIAQKFDEFAEYARKQEEERFKVGEILTLTPPALNGKTIAVEALQWVEGWVEVRLPSGPTEIVQPSWLSRRDGDPKSQPTSENGFYKTIRTPRARVEAIEKVQGKPEFEIGNYMEIYSGPYEGHNFYIADIRYNWDNSQFEYLYDNVLMGGWYGPNQLQCISKRKEK